MAPAVADFHSLFQSENEMGSGLVIEVFFSRKRCWLPTNLRGELGGRRFTVLFLLRATWVVIDTEANSARLLHLSSRGPSRPRRLSTLRLTPLPIRTTTPFGTMNDIRAELAAILLNRQLPCGGWAALSCSSQPVLEPTALSFLALGSEFNPAARNRARQFLLDSQNLNGSWPAFLGDDQEGSWVTSLVLIALRDIVEDTLVRLRGFAWLSNSAGKESNWLWEWKFRTTDRHVKFDPDKFGWPWLPDTNSWVVPTASAILAIRGLPCTCGIETITSRMQRGLEMLLDRVCPGGGWNAGNGVVYGAPLAPHPDDTAIALLALNLQTQEPAVRMSIEWLERAAPVLVAPWSLAWSILALAAHGRSVSPLVDTLLHLPELDQIEDTSTLALVLLAFDCPRGLAAFGVSA